MTTKAELRNKKPRCETKLGKLFFADSKELIESNRFVALCQEFVCYNPARLPSPAQWVNVERCRVKDAYTRVWWMSRNPRPKADNRKVLTGYSSSMKKLLERGTYNSGKRPSQHDIGEESFLTDNGGAIPPNVFLPAVEELLPDFLASLPALHGVLSIANTASNDPFHKHCRENNLALHPAKMPQKLVEFFVRLLTDEKDLVLDPFADECFKHTGFPHEVPSLRQSSYRSNSRANAILGLTISDVYRLRWEEEHAFHVLQMTLICELARVGHPRAALLLFCMSMLAYNIRQVIFAALYAEHPDEKVEEVSHFHVSKEVSRYTEGMLVALDEEAWRELIPRSVRGLVSRLRTSARSIDLDHYKKSRRGPKRKKPKRSRNAKSSHVSTAISLGIA